MKKVTIIAEVGINHNGDIKTAKRLIDAAKFAGANYVKFQKRNIDSVYTQEVLNGLRESPWGTTQREQKAGLEFGKEEYRIIDAYCKDKDIQWFASPWDLISFNFLEEFKPLVQKVASALLTHTKLLTAMAERRVLTYISTGMSTMVEINAAVTIFDKLQCPFIVLHCNSSYPMDNKDANLLMIPRLKDLYKNLTYFKGVGYSGHEVGLDISIAAVALGAIVIERHITLDRTMYGSDQAASVEPMGFYRLVNYIRSIEIALGVPEKIVTAKEEECKKKLRRSLDL